MSRFQKYFFFAAMLSLFVPTAPVLSDDAAEDGPFRVLSELAPENPLLPAMPDPLKEIAGRQTSAADFDWLIDASKSETQGDGGRKAGRNLRFSFSSVEHDEIRLDALRRKDEGGALEKFKGLSSSLQKDSYRQTLESVGRIFEPQVNLRIEF